MQPKEFLKKLGLRTRNQGTSTGQNDISGSRRYLESQSPVDGQSIGFVSVTTREQYDQVIQSAEQGTPK